MKKIVLLLYIVLIANSGSAQKENLVYEDVFFHDSQTGWIVGQRIILNTQNGGLTWDTVFYESGYRYRDIYFQNENTGFIAGVYFEDFNSYAVLLKTSDGGESWDNVMPVAVESLQLEQICFLDENTGWAVGDVILKTIDGGETWFEQYESLPIYLFDVFFTDQNVGWAFGDEIIYTENGGDTWTFQENNSDNPMYTSIFFDQNNGFALGGFHPEDMYTHFTTDNGGDTWVKHIIDITNPEFYDCDFANSTTGWAVGDIANIIKTIDSGSTWTEQDAPFIALKLKGVDFINENEGWAVGQSNAIIHTVNGGDTWEDASVSVEGYKLQEYNLLIHPNPSTGIFSIEFNNQYSVKSLNISVTDIAGKSVKQYSTINKQSTIINIQNQPNGIYFLTITSNNSIIHAQKIIKI